MSVRAKVLAAAESLSKTKPYDQITFAEIAQKAGVHWTAVRRHFGSKDAMRSWLQEKQAQGSSSFTDTRSRIVEAGAHMFSKLGYAHASLDKVAADAGLSKGAVYWHFSSKQDLFLAILETHLTDQLRHLPNQIEGILTAHDPAAALTEWFQANFCFPEAEDGGAMLFLEFVTSSRESEIRSKLQTVHGKLIDGVNDLLKDMQQKGFIHVTVDPMAVSLMIDALLKGLLIEWLIDPERFKGQLVFETISNIIWRGLAPQTREH
ncbi:TetR/AcrR family transcriptional regulator [Marinicrinis lubricantis]|uniref:TetR/AcrR family transcriptional regulator n=1 Tax=Marinicrinis lubricantis TaxID=2086470 RepID=A0ABW1IQX4_9BACL